MWSLLQKLGVVRLDTAVDNFGALLYEHLSGNPDLDNTIRFPSFSEENYKQT